MKFTHTPLTPVERIALVLGLLIVGALALPLRFHATDETYFQLQVARHLATGDGLVFNVGEPVYASSSPLWTTLIADAMVLGLDGRSVARALALAAALASVGLFLQLTRRTLATPIARACATIGWAAAPWLGPWAMAGLETPLAIALVLAGFVAFTEGEEWGSRPVRAGALWALAALTRPEAVFLLVLWATLLLIDAQNRPSVQRLFFGLVPAGTIYGAWLLFARAYYGTFWPASLSVPGGPRGWGDALARFTLEAKALAATDGVLLAVLALSALVLVRHMRPTRAVAQRGLPWLWIVGLPALFAARGSALAPFRMLLVSPVLAWTAWRVAERWWIGAATDASATRRAAPPALIVLALVLAQELTFYATTVVPAARASTHRLDRTHVRWGLWLRANAPRGVWLASREVGALGYWSGHRVLDLSGRVSPAVAELARREPAAAAFERLEFGAHARPDYLVIEESAPQRFQERSPRAGALRLIEIAAPYALYRVDWAWIDSASVTP